MSCSYGVDFQIENHSSKPIKDLSIAAFNTVYIDSIGLNETKIIFLDFKSDRKYTDGGFRIKYNIDTIKYLRGFGYYSNGIPPSHNFIIKIYNDSIKIESVFD